MLQHKLYEIKQNMNVLERSSEHAKNIKPILEKSIKEALTQLIALRNRCDNSQFTKDRGIALDKAIEWLEEQKDILNEMSFKSRAILQKNMPQQRSKKQSIKRPQMNTLSDNLLEFSQFSANFPDKVLKKVNSLTRNLLNPPSSEANKSSI